VTPGLTLTDPQPIEREDMQILASGLTDSVQGFAPLPAVSAELEALMSLYDGTTLKNSEFNVANVKSALSGQAYSIVHVASHGEFSKQANQSFLLTHDSRLDMNTLGELMGITNYRLQPVELLTLSACQTAAGDDRAALGLAGVAVKSGARSALATLWFVNDEASSRLVTEFYRQLRDPAQSKAQSLQNAQLALLADHKYRHPAYWSPFLIIGNWL